MKTRVLFTALCFLSLWGCKQPALFDFAQKDYPLRAIGLNHTEINGMITRETRHLWASFTPTEALDKRIAWTSSDEQVATVDAEGNVTAIELGDAIITATSLADQAISASCTVHVTKTSGIVAYYATNGDAVDASEYMLFFKGSDPQAFFVKVFGMLDTNVDITLSAPDNVMSLSAEEVNGESGFILTPGMALGEGTVTIASKSNPAMTLVIHFSVISTRIQSVTLQYTEEDADGNVSNLSGTALNGTITMNSPTLQRSAEVAIAFTTDIDGVTVPENVAMNIISSDVSVATVSGYHFDSTPSVRKGFFTVNVTDGAVSGQSAVITATSVDGGHQATLTLTIKKPDVKSVTLNQSLSRPVLAGDTVKLIAHTVPSDAYDPTVVWSSSMPGVATVAATPGADSYWVVTTDAGLVFDPTQPALTEAVITASCGGQTATCTLRPYKYVPVAGVMVTDQWGDRLTGNINTANDVAIYNECSAQYAFGAATGNAVTRLGDNGGADQWADADGFPGVKCTSNAVYLTASVWPCVYPYIADPNTQFCWSYAHNNNGVSPAGIAQSRFSIATADNADGSTAEFVGVLNNFTGAAAFDPAQVGKTVIFYTGHGNTASNNMTVVRLYQYDPATWNTATAKKLMFKMAILLNKGADDAVDTKYNWSLRLGGLTGTKGRLCRIYRPASMGSYGAGVNATSSSSVGAGTGIADPVPWPWDGPDVTPSKGPAPVTSNYKTAGVPTRNIADGRPDDSY